MKDYEKTAADVYLNKVAYCYPGLGHSFSEEHLISLVGEVGFATLKKAGYIKKKKREDSSGIHYYYDFI